MITQHNVNQQPNMIKLHIMTDLLLAVDIATPIMCLMPPTTPQSNMTTHHNITSKKNTSHAVMCIHAVMCHHTVLGNHTVLCNRCDTNKNASGDALSKARRRLVMMCCVVMQCCVITGAS